jgi:hypothetical protein
MQAMDWSKKLISWIAAAALCLAGAAQGAPDIEERLSMVGEFTPTTVLASGAAIEAMSFEQKAGFTRKVMSAMPLEDLAALFGFGAGELRWSYRSGGYQQSIAPNIVVHLDASPGERARVKAFAMAWMYVYEQDAVPYFAASAGSGRQSMRLRFGRELTPAEESAMFGAMTAALGKDAGYTRVGDREIVVIDFNDRKSFASDMAAFAAAMEDSNPVVRAEAFIAQSEYPFHDWRAEADGSSLLAQIGKVLPGPGIESTLRELRDRYERIVAGWLASQPIYRAQHRTLALAH